MLGLSAFVNDGEGFYAAVVKIDDEKEFQKLTTPYTDEVTLGSQSDNAIPPWKLESVRKAIQQEHDK